MKNLKSIKPILSAVLCGVLTVNLCSCKDDDVVKLQDELVKESDKDSTQKITLESLTDYVKSLFVLQQDSVYNHELSSRQEKDEINGSIVICDCQEYEQSERFNENMLLDPSCGSIYPGSILDGNSVVDGSYRLISLPRKPLTISTDFFNKEGKSSYKVENPTLSGIRDGIKEMLYDCEINGHTSANASFEIKEVYSEDQLSMAIGTSAKIGKRASISAGFNFDKKEIQSRLLVKLTQVYYTVDIDEPATAGDFFDDSVTSEQLKKELGSTVAPVFVSSVKYGRVAYFAVESTESSETIKAELEAKMKFLMFKGSIDAKVEHISNEKETTITGTVVGGSAETAMGAIKGLEGMINYILSGGNFSKSSPAAPIAFTLKSLSTKQIFGVVNGTKYTIRNCHGSKASIMPAYIQYVSGSPESLNVWGEINVLYMQCTDGITFNETLDDILVWDVKKSKSENVPYLSKTAISYPSIKQLTMNYKKFDYEELHNYSLDFDLNKVEGYYGNLCENGKYEYQFTLGDFWHTTYKIWMSYFFDVTGDDGSIDSEFMRDDEGRYVIEFKVPLYKNNGYKAGSEEIDWVEVEKITLRVGFDINI